TIIAANNYANTLIHLERIEESKALLRRTVPVARRVLGEDDRITLTMSWIYGEALYEDSAATLDDLREAVTTFEDLERIARRVLGGAHPTTLGIEHNLRKSRAALAARKTPSPPPARSV
ncbi:unnamed protein product, partial [Pelagomonas calceolata]